MIASWSMPAMLKYVIRSTTEIIEYSPSVLFASLCIFGALLISHTDEENIAIAKPYVERALKFGIVVEVELGRLEGGEAGLRMISDAKLTDPAKAKAFMEGCLFFSPYVICSS